MLRGYKFKNTLLKTVLKRNTVVREKLENQFQKYQNQFVTETENLETLFEEFKQNYNTTMKMKKGYTHPLDEEDRPINFCSGRNFELLYDVLGPEQVSPHYENFLFSRRWAISIFGVLFGMSYGSTMMDFGWIMSSTFIPFIFYAILYYFFLEGRKTMFL